MSNSTKVILILAALVCSLTIGLGMYRKEPMFVHLGTMVLSVLIVGLVVWALTVSVRKLPFLSRISLSGSTIAAIGVGLYLILVVLAFVEPRIPAMAAALMLLAAPAYVAWHRGESKQGTGVGCMIVGVMFLGGLVLLGLIAAVEPDALEVISGQGQPPASTPLVTVVLEEKETIVIIEEEVISPTSVPAAKAGHWKGEPSVSFEVKSDGRIRDLEIKDKTIPQAACTIEVSSIPIAPDGTLTWVSLIDEDEYWPDSDRTSGLWPTPVTTDSGPMVEALRISGRFDSATTLTGTYKVLVCGDTMFFWNEDLGVESWSAEWQGAGDSK